jgi:hypothetical protein
VSPGGSDGAVKEVGERVAASVWTNESPRTADTFARLVNRGASAPAETTRVIFAEPLPKELLALNATGNEPTAVGTPERTPVDESRFTPGGNPDASKAVGELLAEIGKWKEPPTEAFAVALLEMIGGLEGVPATSSITLARPVPAAFAADTATANVPATVGLPEITPVLGARASPAGSPDTAKVVGEFVAEIA